jgi:hypothetical protein
MTVTGPLLLSAVGIVVAILTGIFAYVYAIGREVSAVSETVKAAQLPVMARNLDRLMYRQELQDAHAEDILHSPEHRERDELVRGLRAHTLTRAEIERVAEMLREAKTRGATAEERLSAVQLLGLAEWEMAKGERDGRFCF